MVVQDNRIIYDNDEWDFIESLSEQQQRQIRRGLLTPYDLGYKPTRQGESKQSVKP